MLMKTAGRGSWGDVEETDFRAETENAPTASGGRGRGTNQQPMLRPGLARAQPLNERGGRRSAGTTEPLTVSGPCAVLCQITTDPGSTPNTIRAMAAVVWGVVLCDRQQVSSRLARQLNACVPKCRQSRDHVDDFVFPRHQEVQFPHRCAVPSDENIADRGTGMGPIVLEAQEYRVLT
jgi:hypothetical protein